MPTTTPRPLAPRMALVGLAAAVALVAAACSGGDDTANPPSTSAGTTSTKVPGTTAGTTIPATSTPTTATPTTAATSTTTTKAPATGTAIRSVDFGEQVLANDSCGSVFSVPPASGYPIHGGEARNGSPGEPTYYSVAVRPDPAIGDLDGNGQEDAVILVDCSTGTTPITFAWAYAPSSVSGSVRRLGGLSLGADTSKQLDSFGDPRLQGVALEGNTIVTTWSTHQPGDPICCPTGQASVLFTWNGSAFVSS